MEAQLNELSMETWTWTGLEWVALKLMARIHGGEWTWVEIIT